MTSEIQRCYRVLELEPEASMDQVKEAWHELVKVWHPDRFQNDDKLQRKAEERLKEINGAYETLEKYLASTTLASESRQQSSQSSAPPKQAEVKEDEILFLKRDVKDETLIGKCKTVLDAWSNQIPFSPIKNISRSTDFVSATEYAAYNTTVTTQIEKREYLDHVVPYEGQTLPPTSEYRSKSDLDIWKINLPRFADFTAHDNEYSLPVTCKVHDCAKCAATGKVTCPKCNGQGEVKCGNCGGDGLKWCLMCGREGKLKKSRSVEKKGSCRSCSGRGCQQCGGRGERYQTVVEYYTEQCPKCNGKGDYPCPTCRNGRVTCETCKGSREVTCPRCRGKRRLLSFVSVKKMEEPARTSNQYIPTGLPQFKKEGNPLSILSGDSVFLQDENADIKLFRFTEQQAAQVLSAEVELCRKLHHGHVLRQQIKIERCSIIEYRYQYAHRDYSIFVNLSHGLVEDVTGPIQTAIVNMDVIAQKAYDENRYEDAYRLNLRSLCMDEASKTEKELRNQILKRLSRIYLMIAVVTWGVASLAWFAFYTTAPDQHGNFGPLLGLLPLLGGVYLFTHDAALRLQQRRARVAIAALIGLSAFLSGAAININSFDWSVNNHGIDWLPFAAVLLALITIAYARSKERNRRVEIEKHIKKFSSVQALESYVGDLDPKKGVEFRFITGMSLVAVCLVSTVGALIAYHTSDKINLADVKPLLIVPTVLPTNNAVAIGNPKPLIGVRDQKERGESLRGQTKVLDLGQGVKLEMVFITPGEFMMGSDDAEPDERPVHKVRLTKGFWLAKAKVTQEQWAVVMGYNPSTFKEAKNPVEQVSWTRATEFCKKVGVRLPTEAEWEYACRAGSTTKYSSGDSEDELARVGWYKANSGDKPHPVGQKDANAWGLYDMHGNVFEWCKDWYGPYSVTEVSDTTGPLSGQYHVTRGGSWSTTPSRCRSTFRNSNDPDNYSNDIGFRVCMNAE